MAARARRIGRARTSRQTGCGLRPWRPGDRATAEAILAPRPDLRHEITADHCAALHRAAEDGDVGTIALLIDCGFDPNRGDEEIGKTALHSAAKAGRPDAVRVLLERGASPDIRDCEFNGQPLVWAAEGARSDHYRAREYGEVAQLLLSAGSPVRWSAGDEPAEDLVEILTEWRRRFGDSRAAMSSTSGRE